MLARASWLGLLGVGHLMMWSVIAALTVSLTVGMLTWGMLSRDGLSAPAWLVDQLEEAAATAMRGGQISIGTVRLQMRDGLSPVVRLRDVVARTAQGDEQVVLPDVRVALSGKSLARGAVVPRRLRVTGARMTILRAEDGSFDLDLTGGMGRAGGSGAPPIPTVAEQADATKPPVPASPQQAAADPTAQGVRSIAAILDAVEGALDQSALEPLDRIQLEQTVVTYIDRKHDRTWTLDRGLMVLEKRFEQISLRLDAPVASDSGDQARLELTLKTARSSDEARLSARFEGIDARDIAGQSDALGWLGVLDAPISGALRAGVGPSGSFTDLNGALQIGAGAFDPSTGVDPIAFDRGKVYFSYRPKRDRLEFSDISFVSPTITIGGSGHAYISGLEQDGAPSFLGQVRLDTLVVDPAGMLPRPLSFTTGALDFRLVTDPFRVDLGQLVLIGDGVELRARGRLEARDNGWSTALDATAGRIDLDRLLQIWPPAAVPRTRAWLTENVFQGTLRDATAAVRAEPDETPRVALNFGFEDATVRFMKTMPHITGGSGHGSVSDGAFALFVEGGRVMTDAGEAVDIAGTTMTIPRITEKPALAKVRFQASSTLTGALQLLDRKPFEVMKKSDRDPGIATGRAEVSADLQFRMVKKVDPADVRYRAEARLLDVASDQIVPTRVVRAPVLNVLADNARVEIGGQGTLDGVPFNGTWTQKMGPQYRGLSRLEGSIELSPRAVTAFRLGLPEGAVTGKGQGDFVIDLKRGTPPRMRLTSDLNRIGLSLAALGWSKPRNVTGTLGVEATLDKPARIDKLTVEAAGLEATGRISLNPDGTLDIARFDRLRMGSGMDIKVDLKGRGRGVPVAVSVQGGRIDLDSLPPRGASGGKGGPLKVALDRLVISDGIALTRFAGSFTGGSGTSGTFTSQLNGAASISGAMVPTRNGPAFRIRSGDAGAVLAASGAFRTARGGSMELVLQPTGQKGEFDGTLKGGDIRVVNAPALASLLSAISVVGLLEQLGGSGIHFGDVEAAFRLTPRTLIIRKSSAVGASMGISLDGTYRLDSKQVDLAGVVSPVYLLNGLGQILTRNREGLFGFNYRLTGAASAPKTTVNPLSILAPGFIRDLFRRDPPKVDE